MRRTLRLAAPRSRRWRPARRCGPSSTIPEIPYDAVRSDQAARQPLSGRSRRRGHQFQGQHLRLHADRQPGGDARHAADVRAQRRAAVRVRSIRQVRPRDRAGHLRVRLRAHRARRSPGQHLGRGRRVEHGHQVRSQRPHRDDDGPKAGGARHHGVGGAAGSGGSGRRRVPAVRARRRRPRRHAPVGAGLPGDNFNRPTDVAWDAAGQHLRLRRLRQLARRQVRQERHASSSRGARAAPRRGSSTSRTRSRSTPRGSSTSATAPTTASRCSTATATSRRSSSTSARRRRSASPPGRTQYLFASNSNPSTSMDNGEIYKMTLDGKILGKFGTAGKLLKEFGSVHEMDCRSENELYVGEITNWRVQKLTLRAAVRAGEAGRARPRRARSAGSPAGGAEARLYVLLVLSVAAAGGVRPGDAAAAERRFGRALRERAADSGRRPPGDRARRDAGARRPHLARRPRRRDRVAAGRCPRGPRGQDRHPHVHQRPHARRLPARRHLLARELRTREHPRGSEPRALLRRDGGGRRRASIPATRRSAFAPSRRRARVGGARLLLGGRGIGSPNAGPGAAAYRGIAYERDDARAGPPGRARAGGAEGRLHQDLGGRSQRPRAAHDARRVARHHRRGAQARPEGERARLLPVRREGPRRRGHRRIRAPRARQGARRRDGAGDRQARHRRDADAGHAPSAPRTRPCRRRWPPGSTGRRTTRCRSRRSIA